MRKIGEQDSGFICDVNAPCFMTLKKEEMELIRFSKTQVQYRKGDMLTKQGIFATYVLFVVKGLAIQYIENGDSKNYSLKIIKPGEFIGLSSVFYDHIFHYSTVAIAESQVVLIEKAAISQLISRNGIFGLGLMNRYMQQNVNFSESLQTVLYKQMNGRLAKSILYINSLKAEYPEIFQLLSRKDIADFANISTESTVKLLKSFEKDELIQLKGKDIQVLNDKGLEEISIKG